MLFVIRVRAGVVGIVVVGAGVLVVGIVSVGVMVLFTGASAIVSSTGAAVVDVVVVVISGSSVGSISSVVVCTALTSADVTVKFKFADSKAELTSPIGSGTTMDAVMGALALALVGMGSVFLITVMTTVP